MFVAIKRDCACLLMGWLQGLDYPRAACLKSSTREKIGNPSSSAKLETDLCCGLESGTREVFNKHLPYWLRAVLCINHYSACCSLTQKLKSYWISHAAVGIKGSPQGGSLCCCMALHVSFNRCQRNEKEPEWRPSQHLHIRILFIILYSPTSQHGEDAKGL